jgi:ribosomal protein S18 acetylase RimI-like enzyme
VICRFPQSAEELFFLYPKASFPLTPEQLQQAIDQRFDSTVVLWNDRLAGFANFYVRVPGEKCAIGNVIVDPQLRGKGVGRYLIETMTAIAFGKHRVREVYLSCFHQNVAGMLLYASLGFQPFAIQERQDRQGHRVALIEMKLTGQGGASQE